MEISVTPQQVKFPSYIKPQQKGYIYIWVSNESENTKVWFDDLKVTHTKSRVVQASDYYAWGSTMREQRTPENETYRYGYQGQFAEKDEETNLNHFESREFDSKVGRWLTIDMDRQFFSPYCALGNNPINSGDSNGKWAILFNRTFMGQALGKLEMTFSYGLIINENTGEFSVAKYSTFAPGFGYGTGLSAGIAIALHPNVNKADQLTGKGLNFGVYGGLLRAFSAEVSLPQDRGGNADYHNVFGLNYAGGNIGGGVGYGAGSYLDFSYTQKHWELTGKDFENYLNNPDIIIRDYLNYMLNKSTEVEHMRLRQFSPQWMKNMVKVPIIEVGSIISGQELVNWEENN